MLNPKIEEELNNQINEEMYSAYLYLSMSAHFESAGLKGFANWMYVQYRDETDHAMNLYNYIHERGGKVRLQAIKEPPHEWRSPLHAFEETLKHEKHITERINYLVDLAEKEKDRVAFNFLQWYVDEQVEEEANDEEMNDEEILAKLRMIGDNPQGIFLIDREMAQRVYTPLTQET